MTKEEKVDFSPRVKPLDFIKEEFYHVAKTALGNYRIILKKDNLYKCDLIQNRCLVWDREDFVTFEEALRITGEHFTNQILSSLL